MDSGKQQQQNSLIAELMKNDELPAGTKPEQDVSRLVGPFPGENRPAPPASPPTANSLLDTELIAEMETSVPQETRKQMNRQMIWQPEPAALVAGGLASAAPTAPAHLSALLPPVIELVNRIRREFEANPSILLSVNKGRRAAIAQHLERLAGQPPAARPSDSEAADMALSHWIAGPRTTTQENALKAYFEEIALFVLAQAVLLKAWSDRGIRAFRQTDLTHLNGALDSALKNFIPVRREGWQITKRNLYSWYTPGSAIQQAIWTTLEPWRLAGEGPSVLSDLVRSVRQHHPDWPELKAYDPRFFRALWKNMASFGFDDPAGISDPLKRRKSAFSPTMRDGLVAHVGPDGLIWAGLESYPFQLFLAELVMLWMGPCAPPLWAVGTGLDTHAREQLPLALGNLQQTALSPKPPLLSQITDMEPCDVSFVFEERCIRANGRSAESLRVRAEVNSLPYYKKIRAASTSLGDLQACVAITKLRPGGHLWWAREEALSSDDGAEMLAFLLDRGKLICEWDLSTVEHTLPGGVPLFPKHLYLFRRETEMEARISNRPLRVTAHGQIRSHVEIPLFFDEALLAACNGPRDSQGRGHWKIHVQQSPNAQKEWTEHWPDPSQYDAIREIEELRQASVPLAAFTTIRPIPEGLKTLPGSVQGIVIRASRAGKDRLLSAASVREARAELRDSDETPEGLLIMLQDEQFIPPLRTYLESDAVRKWLDHHAERRNDHWILNEQSAKYIPVPKALLTAMGIPYEGARPASLPSGTENLAAQAALVPSTVREKLPAFLSALQPAVAADVRMAVFVQSARALENHRKAQAFLFSLVRPNGRIRWNKFFEIMAKSQFTTVTLHSTLVKMSGSVQPNTLIGRMDLVKAPHPGIVFSSESGSFLTLSCEKQIVIDMLWDQLEGIQHATWRELVQHLRLPRQLEMAESAAADVLKTYGSQVEKTSQLTELLNACSVF